VVRTGPVRFSRVNLTRLFHRAFDPIAVGAALGRPERSGAFGATPIVPTEGPIWSGEFDLADGIEEHVVWLQLNSVLGLDEGTPAGTALRYAVTEMLNNAIDHSHGTSAEVGVWSSPDALTFRVSNNGEGALLICAGGSA
jgi:signal transduction histidine kinase